MLKPKRTIWFTILLTAAVCLLPTGAIAVETGTGGHQFPLGTDAGDDFDVDDGQFVIEGDTGWAGLGVTDPSAYLDIGGGVLDAGPDGVDDLLVADDVEIDGNLYVDGYLYGDGSQLTNLPSAAATIWNEIGDATATGTVTFGGFDQYLEGADLFVGNTTLTHTSASEDFSVKGNVEVDRGLYTDGGLYTEGWVGIGTTTPNYRLDIIDASGVQMRISTSLINGLDKNGGFAVAHKNNATEEDVLGAYIQSDGTNNIMAHGGGVAQFNSVSQHRFYTGPTNATLTGTERIRITNIGRVGIGTSVPDGLLHIATGGNLYVDDQVGIGTTAPSADLDVGGGTLDAGPDGTDDLLVADDVEIDGNLYVDGYLYGDGSQLTNLPSAAATTWDNIGDATATGTVAFGGFDQYLEGADLFVGNTTLTHTSGNEDLSVKGNVEVDRGLYTDGGLYTEGWVGIGTTSPQEELHILVDQNGQTSLRVANPNAGIAATTVMSLHNDQGSMGTFSTFSSGFDLGVGYEHLQSRMVLTSSTNASASGISLIAANPVADIAMYTGGSSDSEERMRITSGGFVGIGTSVPDGLLHIATGGNLYVDDQVGIGTTAPSADLDVGGGTLDAGPDGVDDLLVADDVEIDGNLYVDGYLYGDGSQLTNLPSAAATVWNEIGDATATGTVAFGGFDQYLEGADLYIGVITPDNSSTDDDLFVAGTVEVDGAGYIDGPVGIGTSVISGLTNESAAIVDTDTQSLGLAGLFILPAISNTHNVNINAGSGGNDYFAASSNVTEITSGATANISRAMGSYNYVKVDAGQAVTITEAIGSFNEVYHNSTDAITNAYGSYNYIYDFSGAGIISNAYGVYVNMDAIGNNQITNGYGLYIGSFGGKVDNPFSIYTETYKSYFGGDIGIGTTAPDGSLDVATGDVYLGEGTLTYSTSTVDLSVTGLVEIDDRLYVDGGIYATSGWVGIGTTAPSEALQVVGNVKVDQGLYADGGIYTDGWAGIGTTAPTSELDVGGGSISWAGIDGDADLLVAGSAEIDGNLYVDGYLYGDGSQLTNLPSTATTWDNIGDATAIGSVDFGGFAQTLTNGDLTLTSGDLYVGPGTLTHTTTQEDLSVTGNVEVDQGLYTDGGIYTEGWIGVGTTAPKASLDIGGGTADVIDGNNDILVLDDIEVDGSGYIDGNIHVGNYIGLTGATAAARPYNGDLMWRYTTGLVIDTGTGRDLYLNANNGTRISVNSGTGFVGIGIGAGAAESELEVGNGTINWGMDGADDLLVAGSTEIDGNLYVDGYLYGDGSQLTNLPSGASTLDQAYDGGGAGAGRTIDADSEPVVISVFDTDNNAALVVNQFDVTNNPDALQIGNLGSGYSILVDAGTVMFDGDLVVGGNTSRTETIDAAGFSLDGDDLFVAGSLGVESDIYTDGDIHLGSAGMDIATAGADLMVTDNFQVDGQSYFDGNVGIGTTAPTRLLEVDETKTNTAGNHAMSFKSLVANPSADGNAIFRAESIKADTLGANDLSKLTGLDVKAYHTGIGDVTGSIISINADSENTNTGTVDMLYGINTYVDNINGGTVNTGYGHYVYVTNSSGTMTDGYGIYIEQPSGVDSFTGLYIGDVGAGTTDFSIYSDGGKSYFSGDIGIGTTGPSADLDIGGGSITNNIDGTNDLLVSDDVEIDDRLYVDGGIYTNGWVGIGTTAPTSELDVGGGSISWAGIDGDADLLVAGSAEIDGSLYVDGYLYGDGSQLTNLPSGASTLDQAYDGGGAGAGRTVTVDSSSINFVGSNAADYTLGLSNSDNGGVFLVDNAGTGYSILVDSGTVAFDGDTIIGGSTSRTETIDAAGFSMGGDDLFVAGSLGVESDIYTDGDIHLGSAGMDIATAGGDLMVTGNIQSDGEIYLDGTIGIKTFADSNVGLSYKSVDEGVIKAIETIIDNSNHVIAMDNNFTIDTGFTNSTGIKNTFSITTGDPGDHNGFYNLMTSNGGISSSSGVYNNITVTGATASAFGVENVLNSGDNATEQQVYGNRTSLKTYAGANDLGYGVYVYDEFSGGSTGGTQYGLWVDLDDPDVTNYSIWVEPGGGTVYFGGGASSRVGIGITAPSADLDIGGGSITNGIDGIDDLLVADDVEIDGNLYVDGYLYGDGSQLTGITAGASTLDEAYDGGGAGVGRTVTVDQGSVNFVGSNAADYTLGLSNSDNGGVLLVDNAGTGDSFRVNDAVGDTTPFVIDDAGLVGIGTTNPTEELHIVGDVNGHVGTLMSNANAGVVAETSYLVRNDFSAQGSFGVGSTANIVDAYANRVFLEGNFDGNGVSIIASGGDGDDIRFYTGFAITEKMRIEENGFVGIGTTAPSGMLDVATGTVYFGDGTLTYSTSTVDLFVAGNVEVDQGLYVDGGIYTDGWAGIGTTAPTSQLDVGGGAISWAGINGTDDLLVAGSAEIDGNLYVDGYLYGDGSQLTNLPSGASTLDQAYDGGGAGAGRTVTVDSSSINFVGSNAADYTLGLSNSDNGGVLLVDNAGTGPSILVDTGTVVFKEDAYVGGSNETIDGSGFSMGGDDLFVTGQLGVESDIYSDGDIHLGDAGMDIATAGADLMVSGALQADGQVYVDNVIGVGTTISVHGGYTAQVAIDTSNAASVHGIYYSSTDAPGVVFGIKNEIDTAAGADVFGVENSFTVDAGNFATGYSNYITVPDGSAVNLITGIYNTMTNRSATDGAIAYGVRNWLVSGNDAVNQVMYGVNTYMVIYGGAADVAYGERITDGNSTGGTQYGLWVDLDDPDATNYAAWVEPGGGTVYFGGGTGSRVGIGIAAPSADLDIGGGAISWAGIDGADDLLVAGSTEIDGNLYVDGYLYGDGSQLTNLPAATTLWNNIGDATATGTVAFSGFDQYLEGADLFVGNSTLTHTSGNEDLSVKGNVEVDFGLYTDGGLYTEGWVGIGTTAPSASLDIGGGTLGAGPDGTNDLLVADDAEIDGSLYVDGTIYPNYIELPNEPPADNSGHGFVITAQVDTNSNGVGTCLYLNTADGNYDETDADAAATMPCTALTLEAGTGAGKKVLMTGMVRHDSWSWTAGSILYVDTATGALTSTAPSGTGDQVQRVGIAITDDTVFFNPTLTVIEIQ